MKSFCHRRLAVLVVAGAACLLPGCQGPARRDSDARSSAEGIFYPPAPDKPRLQFLTSFSHSGDLGGAGEKVGGLEKFIVGEEHVRPDQIAKPYGIALYDGKLYVCDVQKRMVEVLDLRKESFGYLTKERRMVNPVNICIEGARKYVADPTGGKIFVFGKDNELKAVLGRDLGLKPIDVAVRGKRCYITDMNSGQVVVLDITTGQELLRMGKAGDQLGQFGLIGDIALDDQENVYVTDKVFGRITKFNRDGVFQQSMGQAGDSVHHFVRPKGIAVDRDGRIWVVDAAPEVTKVYNADGQLLMFFGFPGDQPGNMNMPAAVVIDYDDVDLFEKYFAKEAKIEFLVFVSNQFGDKVNVYGFGEFPRQEQAIVKARSSLAAEIEQEPRPQVSVSPSQAAMQPGGPQSSTAKGTSPSKPETAKAEAGTAHERMNRIAEIYYRSMAFYRAGQLKEARDGFMQVLGSGSVPPAMAATIRSYVVNIDKELAAGPSRSPQ